MISDINKIIDNQKISAEYTGDILNYVTQNKDKCLEIIAIDSFNYGIIIGKRIERKKFSKGL